MRKIYITTGFNLVEPVSQIPAFLLFEEAKKKAVNYYRVLTACGGLKLVIKVAESKTHEFIRGSMSTRLPC